MAHFSSFDLFQGPGFVPGTWFLIWIDFIISKMEELHVLRAMLVETSPYNFQEDTAFFLHSFAAGVFF